MTRVAIDFWLGHGAREAAGLSRIIARKVCGTVFAPLRLFAILPERGDTAQSKKRRNPEGGRRLGRANTSTGS